MCSFCFSRVYFLLSYRLHKKYYFPNKDNEGNFLQSKTWFYSILCPHPNAPLIIFKEPENGKSYKLYQYVLSASSWYNWSKITQPKTLPCCGKNNRRASRKDERVKTNTCFFYWAGEPITRRGANKVLLKEGCYCPCPYCLAFPGLGYQSSRLTTLGQKPRRLDTKNSSRPAWPPTDRRERYTRFYRYFFWQFFYFIDLLRLN